MNEQPANSNGNDASGERGAASFSDEAIRRFLLCLMNADERTRFEESLFTDSAMDARVRQAECELTDDYAFNRLSAEERALFAKNFIVTAERKQKLAVSQALRRHLAPQAAAKKNTAAIENTPAIENTLNWRERLLGLFDFTRPALAFAASLSVIVFVGGLIWFIARNVREHNEPLIVRQLPSPQPAPQTSPQVVASPTPNSTPTPSTNPTQNSSPKTTPTPAELSPPRATIASFTLLPGALRDGGEMSRITLPKGERDIVRLQLSLETNEAGAYQAEVLTAEGQSISTVRKLKASATKLQAQVIFDVPARLLKVGDYQVKLTHIAAAGGVENVGRYYFRALSK
jgi:hypothetical protein